MIPAILTDLAKYYVTHDPAPVNLSLMSVAGRDRFVIHDAPHAVVRWVYTWIESHRDVHPTITANLTSEGLVIT